MVQLLNISFIFIPLLLIISLSGSIVALCKKRFSECLPVIMLIIPIILMLSQILFRSFLPGEFFLIAIGILSFVFVIISLRRGEFREHFLSVGLIAFLFIYFLLFVLLFQRKLQYWDELAFWGKAVKELLRLDKFYFVSDSTLLVHLDYPPFMSVFQMFWCFICGGFSEMNLSLSLHVFMFAFFSPWLAEEFIGKSHDFAAKTTRLFVFTIFPFFVFSIFDIECLLGSIYIDLVFPFVFLYAIFQIINNKMSSLFGRVSLYLLLISLPLIKQIGLLFGIFILLIWIVFEFEQNTKLQWILKSVIGLASLILPYLSWKLLINLANISNISNTSNQFSASKISLTGFFNILIGQGSSIQIKTKTAFFSAVFHQNLTSSSVNCSFFVIILTCCIIILVLFLFCRNVFPLRKFVLLEIICIFFSAIYMIGMLLLYMFCFSDVEMSTLASFSRYMETWTISVLLLTCVICIYYLRSVSQKVKKVKKGLMIASILAMLLLTNYNNLNQFKYSADCHLKRPPVPCSAATV